jgi:hypothetical protein
VYRHVIVPAIRGGATVMDNGPGRCNAAWQVSRVAARLGRRARAGDRRRCR